MQPEAIAIWGLVVGGSSLLLIGALTLFRADREGSGETTVSLGPFRLVTKSQGISVAAVGLLALGGAVWLGAVQGADVRSDDQESGLGEAASPGDSSSLGPSDPSEPSEPSSHADKVDSVPPGFTEDVQVQDLAISFPPEWRLVEEEDDLATLESPDGTTRLIVVHGLDRTGSASVEELGQYIFEQTPGAGADLTWESYPIAEQSGRYSWYSNTDSAAGFDPRAGFVAAFRGAGDNYFVYVFVNVSTSGVDAFNWGDAALAIVDTSSF